ncbi:MAG: ABC transporter ATP-binding protein/permease [Defluviitaleaceae bacterium]|nr:ABC transporter ATP-binding protein/permease [Defluviitaleaceae bacterium]
MKNLAKILLAGWRIKGVLAAYIGLAFGVGFVVILANNMLRGIFNEHIMARDFEGMGVALMLTIGGFALVFCIQLLNTWIRQRFVWNGQLRLIEFYTARLLRAEHKYFIKNEAPAIWSDINMSTQGGANLFGNCIEILSAIIGFVFYGIVVFRIDFYAGIFTIIAMPLFFLLTFRANKAMMPLQHDVMAQHRAMAVVAQEAMANAANVKAKNAYDFFIGRIIAIQEKISICMQKINVTMTYANSISGTVSIIAPILILLASMSFSDTLAADLGTVLVLYINIPLFLRGFTGIFQSYVIIRSGFPALSRLRLLDDIPAEPSGDISINGFDSLVVSGVCANFGERKISIPDFEIHRGEKVMFVGESGIGKSTIFNIIMGLNHDYEGDVLINGENLRNLKMANLRDFIGIAFQSVNVLTLTLRENIALGLDNFDIDEIIDTAHLKTQAAGKAGEILANSTLSGGEKSRLGLAQTLARRPDAILIDESFSNLDEEMEAAIIAKLFAKYADKTILCISHRNASRPYFNRIVNF